jgi:transcription-repair coupling factor (superfamily II helicase)
MKALDTLKSRLDQPGRISLSALPEGLDALLLPDVAKAAGMRGVVHVTRDDQHMAALEEQIAYFAPELDVVRFPAWDCLPYDRVSPSADILAKRLAVLAQLIKPTGKPFILLTTINAILQRDSASRVTCFRRS